MAMVAGIDWSMTCPSICIYDTSKPLLFENCTLFFYSDKIKFHKSFGKNIHGMLQKPHNSQEERFDNLAEWAITIMNRFKVSYATMEGYSMGSKGAVFNIGENGGILKNRMWKNNIEFQVPAPTAVKKHFTGSGAAKKEVMHDTLVRSEGVNVSTLIGLNTKPKDSPISDVVDAYAMVHYMIKSPDSKYMR